MASNKTQSLSTAQLRKRDIGSYPVPILCLTPSTEELPWDDLRKILYRGQGWLIKVQNGEEILPKVSTPWVGRMNVTDDRQTTDGFALANTQT